MWSLSSHHAHILVLAERAREAEIQLGPHRTLWGDGCTMDAINVKKWRVNRKTEKYKTVNNEHFLRQAEPLLQFY